MSEEQAIAVSGPKTAALAEVRARFTYHPPRAEDIPKYEANNAAFLKLAEFIVATIPAGRERATALTHLSEARMHCNAGIALAGTDAVS